MDILDKIEMDGFESSYNNFSMIWKSYQVLREGLKVSNDEIDELIKYHTSKEEFEICEKLNKIKTII
jgi:aerobic-type carbon monoxide dehydrogenase small subunit (CoxS/CutS family)